MDVYRKGQRGIAGCHTPCTAQLWPVLPDSSMIQSTYRSCIHIRLLEVSRCATVLFEGMVMIGQVCREQMRERDEVWALLAQVLMCQRRRVPLAMPLFKPGRVQVGGEPRELRVPRGRKRDNEGIFWEGCVKLRISSSSH